MFSKLLSIPVSVIGALLETPKNQLGGNMTQTELYGHMARNAIPSVMCDIYEFLAEHDEEME